MNDNKKIAAKFIAGTFGIMIGLAFLKIGGARILTGLEMTTENLVKTIKDAA